MGAAAVWNAAEHPRGAGGLFAKSGRTVQRKRLGGGEKQVVPRLGGTGITRESKLKKAATTNHNRVVAAKVWRKGRGVTPLDAAFKKTRRAMGTQPQRVDYTRSVIPQDHQKSWLRLNWDKVPNAPR